jgi:hypothetical protein
MNFKDSDFSVPDVDLSVPVSGTRPHNCTGQRPMHAKKNMKINMFEYIVMRKMIFSSEKPPKN